MIDPKDILVNGKQLSEILESHKKWLLGKDGERANLSYANLSYADLSSANLSSADLSYANLSYADLSYADLRYANLSYADLRSANLSYADLSSANLSYADLRSANLRYAKNIEMVCAITSILPDGDIIGWKKCREGIVKLLIPAKAKRSNSTGRKCRAEYAIDKAHFTFDGKKTKKNFTSTYDADFIYSIGSKIITDSFDENRWEECSSGIHFFITRWEAENY